MWEVLLCLTLFLQVDTGPDAFFFSLFCHQLDAPEKPHSHAMLQAGHPVHDMLDILHKKTKVPKEMPSTCMTVGALVRLRHLPNLYAHGKAHYRKNTFQSEAHMLIIDTAKFLIGIKYLN